MLATRPGGMGIGRLAAIAVTAALVAASVPADRAEAVPADTPIVIDGGGWGHGIGMPQWGAQAMADKGGHTYDQILAYWYDGTGLAQASQVSPAVPQTVRVGINYVIVGGTKEFRPFLWLDFNPVNGAVGVCLPGENDGGCSLAANPGETWRYRWFNEDGGFCAVTRNGDNANPLYKHASACDVRLFWPDQPNTRVSFPGGDVARTFARGHVAFLGPVTVNGQTGFHLNVVLSLEEYMYGIGEVPNTWHMEALKAQVVAARTFGAWRARGGVRSDCSCNLVWDTMDQAYRGWYTSSTNPITEGSPDGDRWRAAVDATAGQVVVTEPGGTKIAETYYSSSSGGATENVSDMWGSNQDAYPYLVSKPDPWSVMYAGTPTETTSIRWRHTRSAGQIVDALANDSCGSGRPAPFPGLTEVTSIEIVETHVSGSPRAIAITGLVNGKVTSKTFYHRATNCDDRIGTIRSRLGLRGHFIYAFAGFSTATRLSGENRFETAVAVSRDSYPSGAAVVYIAVGTNYPDALASGPAAAHENAPILLVNKDGLPAVTRDELQRLAPTQIRVLGGEAAIAPSVVSAVSAAVPGATVTRIAGANRYETAVEISRASFTESVTTVYIATGENFPDGLVAAPAATRADAPLLLVRSNEVPAVVAAELTRLGPDEIIIVGGTAAVSSAVENTLEGYATTVSRISAADRYAQSAAVSAATFPADTGTVYIAVGTDFPDALAGGTALGTSVGPILLVGTNSIPTAVANELLRIRPARIVILGGPVVVSEAVATQLAQYLG